MLHRKVGVQKTGCSCYTVEFQTHLVRLRIRFLCVLFSMKLFLPTPLRLFETSRSPSTSYAFELRALPNSSRPSKIFFLAPNSFSGNKQWPHPRKKRNKVSHALSVRQPENKSSEQIYWHCLDLKAASAVPLTINSSYDRM